MAEFSAAAELDVRVTDDSIRSARRQIESELGDVGVSAGGGTLAPDGGSAGGIGRGQRAGILDATRKTLGETETLVELAEARNELLEELGGQGGGGGGGLAAVTRGLGPLVGGVAGGAVALGGLLGTDREAAEEGRQTPAGRFNLGVPDLPGGGQQVPAGRDFSDVSIGLDIPEGFPPELQLPEGFPPELQVPEGIPPELQVPEIPPLDVPEVPAIDITVPSELSSLANGLDVNFDVSSDFTIDLDLPPELQDLESTIRRIAREEAEAVGETIRQELEGNPFGIPLFGGPFSP